LKTGDCHDALIDVGAHFGLYSVILGVLNPELPLYSFEPSPYNAEICRENIEANHIDGEVFEAAVGRSNSRAQLNMRTRPGNGLQFFNSTIAHSIVTEKEDMKNDSSVTVPTRALSSFCAEQGICHPFVKIDAEGAEHRIVNDLLNEADIDGISGIVELHPDLIPDSEGYAHEILFWFEQEGIDFECVKSHNPSRPAYYFTT
jgi:FkbM family methyltransferase